MALQCKTIPRPMMCGAWKQMTNELYLRWLLALENIDHRTNGEGNPSQMNPETIE